MVRKENNCEIDKHLFYGLQIKNWVIPKIIEAIMYSYFTNVETSEDVFY